MPNFVPIGQTISSHPASWTVKVANVNCQYGLIWCSPTYTICQMSSGVLML